LKFDCGSPDVLAAASLPAAGDSSSAGQLKYARSLSCTVCALSMPEEASSSSEGGQRKSEPGFSVEFEVELLGFLMSFTASLTKVHRGDE
jgi:hypothetical protein